MKMKMKMNMECVNSSYNFSFSFDFLLILIIYNTWILGTSLIKEKTYSHTFGLLFILSQLLTLLYTN
jgi:hypothetical protein